MLLLTSKINALLNTYAAVTRKAEGGYTKNCKQGQNIVTPFLSSSDSTFTTELQYYSFGICFHLHAASCAFLGCATQKFHKFSLQPKAGWNGSDALSGSRDVTCRSSAPSLPSGEGLEELKKKLSLNLIPETVSAPGHFFLHHKLAPARLLPTYVFNSRIAQESKLLLE